MPAEVTLYTTNYCGFCHRAKALLARKGVSFEEIDVGDRPDLRTWLRSATHQTTVPQVFINGRSILDDGGALDPALSEDAAGRDFALRR